MSYMSLVCMQMHLSAVLHHLRTCLCLAGVLVQVTLQVLVLVLINDRTRLHWLVPRINTRTLTV